MFNNLNEILKPRTFEEIDNDIKNIKNTIILTDEDLNSNGLRKNSLNLDITLSDLKLEAKILFTNYNLVIFKKDKIFKILKNQYGYE